MIGWFPTPYPDELLYSICARYKEQVAYPNDSSANEDLFGHREIYAGIVLPAYLERLVSALPSGHNLTAERLMDNHTLVPFYSYFLPASRVERIREEMRYGTGSRIYRLSGLYNYSIRTPEWLRFCPACVIEDRSRFGCTYWHRVHQLPGVEVCPAHAIFLENTQISARGHIIWHGYAPAEHAIKDDYPARPLDQSNTTHTLQLGIAQDAKWLLLRGNAPCDLIALIDRYLALLSDLGMAIMSGRVWVRKLLPAFKDHFTSDNLKLLQSDFDETCSTSWPAVLFKNLRAGKAHHPLHHFLMMRFLGHSAESFFKLPATRQPFGTGPWPCLNRTCSQYETHFIVEAAIVYRRVSTQGILPVATFKCSDCGFTYYRAGPDRESKDFFRIGRILEYGPVWEAALRKYWKDSTLTLPEVAKRLGVSSSRLIKREAERLGLPFPRHGPGNSVVEKNSKQERRRRKKKPSKEKINEYRRKWRLYLKNNPGLSVKALREKHGHHLYNWLKWNDSEWFAAHRTQPRKRRKPRSRVNWRVRDVELATAVKTAAKLLKKLSGRPVKITAALIARNIETGSKLGNQLHQLPRTREALKKVVETRLEFAERRLWWAVKCCRDENVSPSRSAFRRHTKILSSDWKDLLLKAATDEALRSVLTE